MATTRDSVKNEKEITINAITCTIFRGFQSLGITILCQGNLSLM